MATTVAELTTALRNISVWPRYPFIYEINTWVWLSEMSQEYANTINLSSVPSAEWDAIAALGFDAVWLMGVWERSPAGIAISNRNKNLFNDFRRALPDFRLEDNVGSPYCVRSYVVDDYLGGPEALAVARREIAKRGMNLILDFVPNHVAPDHPWVTQYPHYFIRNNVDDLNDNPASWLELCGTDFACGRDPYFPAWPDVLQLNAFEPELRRAVIETLLDIARQCDGVRCDMAMLVLNSVFERTWGTHAEKRPSTEYWREIIPAVKNEYPSFLFIAEAYWGLEWELQQQGFDFCYDKTLYDRLAHRPTKDIRLHLCADRIYQDKLLRFMENHDEPRAATTFSPAKERAVALTVATLPGTRLFHEGQFEGRKVRLPVFLARRPVEHFDRDLNSFYVRLLEAVNRRVFHDGQWALCNRTGWPDNDTFQNLLAWTWSLDEERYLIVVNLSDVPAQARVQVPWLEVEGQVWNLVDPVSNALYERSGDEISCQGLYVELGAWDYHFFQFVRAHKD